MGNERHELVLGIDEGIASTGFCLLDMTDHTILEMGSHLHKAPQDNKGNSLAANRRNARSARRNNQRTNDRLKHCLELLKEAGLVPGDADRAWFQTVKKDKPILKLRAVGLNRLLTDREFAQVLYSLCNHRGYIPHGEGRQGETDDEGKKVLSAIKENSERLASSNYRTIGEMLNAKGESRNKNGNYNYCVLNKQIQDEARLIFEIQRNRGNHKATKQLEEDYIKCLIWEKYDPDYDKKVYEEVGPCTYFPDEKRAAKADPSSELCSAYEKFKHLTIVNEDGSETRLEHARIDSYVATLFSTSPIKTKTDPKDVTYGKIRKALGLSDTAVFKGINKDKESAEVYIPKSWRCLRRNMDSRELLERMLSNRELGDAICESLTFASSEESLRERLKELDLDDMELESILNVPFTGKLFKGYGNRSLKALNMLIGAFEEEEVRTLSDAEQTCGLQQKRLTDKCDRLELLPPYEDYDPSCSNPVVLRSISRMRRIINSIIKIYGVPDKINIEVARKLKQSKAQQASYENNQKKNERANRCMAELAAGILDCSPDEVEGKVIRKLIMREEQGAKDPYFPNDVIDLERLVRDDAYAQIDHILPYSRTADNSRANKVLTLAKHNQDKRERTPYEWMTSGEESAPDWDEFRSHVMAHVKYPKKRANLLNTELDENPIGFIKRNINDTKYMAVAVKDYIEDCLAFPEDGKRHVFAVAGRATATLRHAWGLNFGAGNTKDRDDDRHHAVDAAVIAACSSKTVAAIANAHKRGRETFERERDSRLSATQPWPTFASDVVERRKLVVPTRMADHGVTGAVFKDFVYRLEAVRESGHADISRQSNKVRKSMPQPQGNYVVQSNGGVRLHEEMAFLRLWNDKGNGRWYAEPVYYADVPQSDTTEYVPKAYSRGVARVNWEEVPPTARQNQPLVLFAGDVLRVDDHLGRFRRFKISNGQLFLDSLIDGEQIKGWPQIAKWNAGTQVSVFQEDCLGHCYENIELNPEDSTFKPRQP